MAHLAATPDVAVARGSAVGLEPPPPASSAAAAEAPPLQNPKKWVWVKVVAVLSHPGRPAAPPMRWYCRTEEGVKARRAAGDHVYL